MQSAVGFALREVGRVRDDPQGRLALMRRLYEGPPGHDGTHLPYRRAASAFMGWQLRRGLLNPLDGSAPGSPWWRAVNERLLRDGCEAFAIASGQDSAGSSVGAAASVEFITRPTAQNWYRAHNVSIVSAYLENRVLADDEHRTERFFINLVLVRVLFAHAMVAAPRMALSWLAPLGPLVGDPRVGVTGIYLSLSRILPDHYPLGDDVERFVAREHSFGHLVDVGVIAPRFRALYEWSAAALNQPGLASLLLDGVPAYAWSAEDSGPWDPPRSLVARLARRMLPRG